MQVLPIFIILRPRPRTYASTSPLLLLQLHQQQQVLSIMNIINSTNHYLQHAKLRILLQHFTSHAAYERSGGPPKRPTAKRPCKIKTSWHETATFIEHFFPTQEIPNSLMLWFLFFHRLVVYALGSNPFELPSTYKSGPEPQRTPPSRYIPGFRSRFTPHPWFVSRNGGISSSIARRLSPYCTRIVYNIAVRFPLGMTNFLS